MSTPWEITEQARRMLDEAGQARQQASAMMAMVERRRDELVGIALWCSTGEHSFGQQDRKRATFTVESFDDDGNTVKETALMCGPCAEKRRDVLRKQPAIPAGADAAEYTAYLEWKAGMRDEPKIGESGG